MKISVVSKILEANDRLALENRRLFDRHKTYTLNLMSGQGRPPCLSEPSQPSRESCGLGS
jgi:hypothetical protein